MPASNRSVFCRYLSDVNAGDGGLLVIEGSHKAAFERPTPDLYKPFGGGNPVPADQVTGVPWDTRAAVGLKNVVPVRAGDVLVMPEALTHAVMPCVLQLSQLSPRCFGCVEYCSICNQLRVADAYVVL